MNLPYHIFSLRQLRKYQKELQDEYIRLTNELRAISDEFERRAAVAPYTKAGKKDKSNSM